MDPKEDLVCLPWIRGVTGTQRDEWLFQNSIWSEEALKLEKIAIDSRAWFKWSVIYVLTTFKSLKELTVIVHSDNCRHELWGSKTVDLNLSKFFSIGVYQDQLNEFWKTDGAKKDGKWKLPKLLGMHLDCDGKRCCMPVL